MLSPTEVGFLKDRTKFKSGYSRVLACRILKKLHEFETEVALLSSDSRTERWLVDLVSKYRNSVTSVTDSRNGIAQTVIGSNASKRIDLTESTAKSRCGEWDSNPRRPTPQGPKPDTQPLNLGWVLPLRPGSGIPASGDRVFSVGLV